MGGLNAVLAPEGDVEPELMGAAAS
jgi:hypothetical protein